MSLDLTNLSPQDAIAALRSYPRRFAEVLEPIKDDDNVQAFATRPGPDGESALELALTTAAAFGSMRDALRAILREDNPTLSAPPSGSDGTSSIPDAIDRLRREADALAADIDHVDAGEWIRSGTRSSGEKATAFDLVRDAVRLGSDNLRRADAAMSAARRG